MALQVWGFAWGADGDGVVAGGEGAEAPAVVGALAPVGKGLFTFLLAVADKVAPRRHGLFKWLAAGCWLLAAQQHHGVLKARLRGRCGVGGAVARRPGAHRGRAWA